MATEDELKAWREELRGLAVRRMARELWDSIAEREADTMLTGMLMRWHSHPASVPQTPEARARVVRRSCRNHAISYMRVRANRMDSLDAPIQEGSKTSFAEVQEGVTDEPRVLESERGFYVAQLREELDRLRWPLPRTSKDVYLWLVLLLELRGGMVERVHGDALAAQLDEALAQLALIVPWQAEEELERFSAERPQLMALWQGLGEALWTARELRQVDICEAFERLGSEVKLNTYQQWLSRMRRRLLARCEELEVSGEEMMRRLWAGLRPEEVSDGQ